MAQTAWHFPTGYPGDLAPSATVMVLDIQGSFVWYAPSSTQANHPVIREHTLIATVDPLTGQVMDFDNSGTLGTIPAPPSTLFLLYER
jgi:hypothetical protein